MGGFKAVAGTKQAVAFAYWDRFRGDKLVSVRDAATRPADPEIYNHGYWGDEVGRAPDPTR